MSNGHHSCPTAGATESHHLRARTEETQNITESNLDGFVNEGCRGEGESEESEGHDNDSESDQGDDADLDSEEDTVTEGDTDSDDTPTVNSDGSNYVLDYTDTDDECCVVSIELFCDSDTVSYHLPLAISV